MKTLLAILLATFCAATGYAQTIRSLVYNSTNGNIIAATNVVWTNAFNFSSNSVTETVRNNLQAAASTNLGPDTAGAANRAIAIANNDSGAVVLEYDSSGGEDWEIVDAEDFRDAIDLGLQSLTNTSNVTMMRALSGSTNTNHPFSGSVSVVGTNNTNVMVFSNGVLQSVQ
jgi:hypothetical protein